MKTVLQALLLCAVFLTVLVSCTRQLDFDQADRFNTEPEVVASILYFEVPERIINLQTDQNLFSEDFNFDAFSSNFFAKRVIEGTIRYEVENSTTKEMLVAIELLDAEDMVLDTETFMIQPAPTTVIEREIVYGPSGKSIDILKNTSKIRVRAENLGDTTSASVFPNPLITLKSKGTFRLTVL